MGTGGEGPPLPLTVGMVPSSGLPSLGSQDGDSGLDSGTERFPSVGEVGAGRGQLCERVCAVSLLQHLPALQPARCSAAPACRLHLPRSPGSKGLSHCSGFQKRGSERKIADPPVISPECVT